MSRRPAQYITHDLHLSPAEALWVRTSEARLAQRFRLIMVILQHWPEGWVQPFELLKPLVVELRSKGVTNGG
jgi:hypothetical protein